MTTAEVPGLSLDERIQRLRSWKEEILAGGSGDPEDSAKRKLVAQDIEDSIARLQSAREDLCVMPPVAPDMEASV